MAADDLAAGSISPEASPATRVRYGVLGFLCSLSVVLYLDRVCISMAEVPMRRDLNLSKRDTSLVLAAFTIAYGLFQVPAGRWGDRYGARGVLTGIVLCWSVFTALTSAASGLAMLVVVRFLFGAGEAGALPNACRVVARWFPAPVRGRAQGLVIASALIGGALTPTVAEYLIARVGWRGTFVVFGGMGCLWAAAFYAWFRDNPEEHPRVNDRERQLIAADSGPGGTGVRTGTGGTPVPLGAEHPPVPWRFVLSSRNVWVMGGIMTCASFVYYMYISWYSTYLKEGRGVGPEVAGWLVSMVLAGGALSGVLGGYLNDWLLQMTGSRRWSRRAIGGCAFLAAALALLASVRCESPVVGSVFVGLACLSAQMQLASWWAVTTEISGKHVGALFGLMNSMGVPGAAGSQLFLGHFVDWLGAKGYSDRQQWDPAFYIYAAVLVLGACCWLLVDATKSVVEPEVDASDRVTR